MESEQCKLGFNDYSELEVFLLGLFDAVVGAILVPDDDFY